MVKKGEIALIKESDPTIEGAGVRLRRALGPEEAPLLDPFLLLDDFHSKDPADYLAGFPWHPHRGIETVTYVIRGLIEHGDSIGNKGAISSGDVQWMTAGGGILHQEMPQRYDGMMQGFQLWVNLPAADKMMPPRYREVPKDRLRPVTPAEGVKARIIAGELDGTKGPVQDIVIDVEYMDFEMEPDREFEHRIGEGMRSFAYVFGGDGLFGSDDLKKVEKDHLVVFGETGMMTVRSGKSGLRFMFASGRPLWEPIAWGGPIVMNTQEELELAFRELRNGTFIKK